jgi:deazaflavin-dependent oxidoreductase (nitroreductase family)
MWRPVQRLLELEYFLGEFLIDPLLPADGPSRPWQLIFKLPLVLYRYGLHPLVSGHVLILTTVGRKTGKSRSTPLGYRFDPATETYYVIAGWKGRTNWYQNALTTPAVRVRIGSLDFEAYATPLSTDEIASHLSEYAKRNPFATRMYRNFTGIKCNGTHETLLKIAQFYPGLAIRQVEQHL